LSAWTRAFETQRLSFFSMHRYFALSYFPKCTYFLASSREQPWTRIISINISSRFVIYLFNHFAPLLLEYLLRRQFPAGVSLALAVVNSSGATVDPDLSWWWWRNINTWPWYQRISLKPSYQEVGCFVDPFYSPIAFRASSSSWFSSSTSIFSFPSTRQYPLSIFSGGGYGSSGGDDHEQEKRDASSISADDCALLAAEAGNPGFCLQDNDACYTQMDFPYANSLSANYPRSKACNGAASGGPGGMRCFRITSPGSCASRSRDGSPVRERV